MSRGPKTEDHKTRQESLVRAFRRFQNETGLPLIKISFLLGNVVSPASLSSYLTGRTLPELTKGDISIEGLVRKCFANYRVVHPAAPTSAPTYLPIPTVAPTSTPADQTLAAILTVAQLDLPSDTKVKLLAVLL